jgi:3-deoxy-D-manno-octulosonate 8-phosphate phosphatase (KDO 8-P phosphatase)
VKSLQSKAAAVRLLLLDVDGVLTDGTVTVHSDGSESKSFGIRDGIALVWAQRSGLRVGLLSARHSPTTLHRARQLGITLIHQGVASKVDTFARILAAEGVSAGDVAYMADDIVDLGVLARAGFSCAPADAVPEVRGQVDWVSQCPGGGGAVRELVELILRARGSWDAIVDAYQHEGRETAAPDSGDAPAAAVPGRDPGRRA